jgi:hypothetical protein
MKGEVRVISPRFLEPCHIGAAVLELGRLARVRVGFESTPDCWLSSPGAAGRDDDEVLTGMSVRQAFDHLMTLMPMFSWKEMDGVAVVRPKAAWDDPKNPLNFPTKPFEATGETSELEDVLHTVLQAVTPSVFYPKHWRVRGPEPAIDRPVAVAFPGGTMLEAINAVVRARQDVWWELGHTGSCDTLIVNTIDLHGGWIAEPVDFPHARR